MAYLRHHRETGEIVAYVWGKRDLATVQRLKTKLRTYALTCKFLQKGRD